jgi:membrane protein implicated in regulation of membrane protease activity
MPQKRRRSAADIRRELRVVERELSNLIRIQWTYAKRMLKFGMAAWIFGLCTFFLAIVILNPGLIWEAPLLAAPLLVIAAAAPVLITAVVIRKFSYKIKRLERIRRGLLVQYEKAVLKRIGEMISSAE